MHVGCIAPPPVRQGLDRLRALAPRSPARLRRSNDPHPVQCNDINERHLFWEIAGVVVAERYLVDAIATVATSRMRRRNEEGVKRVIARHRRATAKRGGWRIQPSNPLRRR